MSRRLSVVLLGLSACSGVASSSVTPPSPAQSEPRAEVEPVVTTDSNTAPEALRTAPHEDLDAFVAFVAEAARLDDREALALATADPLPSPTGTILDRQLMLDSLGEVELQALRDELSGPCVHVETRRQLVCSNHLHADATHGDGVWFIHTRKGWFWAGFRPVFPSLERGDVPSRPSEAPVLSRAAAHGQVARIKGALDKDVIRRVVRSHMEEVRGCYNEGLARDPNLQGRVAIQFAITPDGTVSVATVGDSDVPDDSVTKCIAAAVRTWEFPKPQGGGNVVVTYPFVLVPG